MMPSGSVTDYIKSKRIKVYANGESHCYNFTLNPRQFKGWTAILIYLTEILKPCGHIHKIIELKSRKEIHCFDDIVSDETYIALGKHSKFKLAPGGYEYLSHRDILRRATITKKYYAGEPDPSLAQFLMETEKKHLTVVYFVVNGKTCQSPQKVVLNKYDLMRSGVTRNYLAKILDVPTGVQFVATIFGDILKDLRELQHGFPYVALPYNDAFVNMDYLNFFSEENGFKPPLTFNIQQIVNKDKSEKSKGYSSSLSISRTKEKPIIRENNGGSVTSESVEVDNREKIQNDSKEPIFNSNKAKESKSVTDNLKEIEEIKKIIEGIQKAIEETQKAIKETQKETEKKLKRRLTVEETNENKVKLEPSLIVAKTTEKNQTNIKQNLKPKLIAGKSQKDIKETLKPILVVEEFPTAIEENQKDIKNQLKPRLIAEETQKEETTKAVEENEIGTKEKLTVEGTRKAIEENQDNNKENLKPSFISEITKDIEENQKDVTETFKLNSIAENTTEVKQIQENAKEKLKPSLIVEVIPTALEEIQKDIKEKTKSSLIVVKESITALEEIQKDTKERSKSSLAVVEKETTRPIEEIQNDNDEKSKFNLIVIENNKYEDDKLAEKIRFVVENKDEIEKSKSNISVPQHNDKLAIKESNKDQAQQSKDITKYEKKEESKYSGSIVETKRGSGSIICSQNILIKPCNCVRSKLTSSDEEIDESFNREDKKKRPM